MHPRHKTLVVTLLVIWMVTVAAYCFTKLTSTRHLNNEINNHINQIGAVQQSVPKVSVSPEVMAKVTDSHKALRSAHSTEDKESAATALAEQLITNHISPTLEIGMDLIASFPQNEIDGVTVLSALIESHESELAIALVDKYQFINEKCRRGAVQSAIYINSNSARTRAAELVKTIPIYSQWIEFAGEYHAK